MPQQPLRRQDIKPHPRRHQHPKHSLKWPNNTNFIMVATIHTLPTDTLHRMSNTMHTSTFSAPIFDSHIWLVDSAASSHLLGNQELFQSLNDIPPITIETASGDSFTANQLSTICIKIIPDPSYWLPNVPIMLTDIIYAPKLKANLLSVRQMTNSNVSIIFGKHSSTLTYNSQILAHGPKVNNLFTYIALLVPQTTPVLANYFTEPSDIFLWHHRLSHTRYSTLETMKRLHTAIGFMPKVHHGPSLSALAAHTESGPTFHSKKQRTYPHILETS